MRGSRRNPLVWLALTLLTTSLGIGSRGFVGRLPGFLAAYTGDTLWVLAAFLGFGLVRPRGSTWRVALLAIASSVLIEVS